MAITKVKVLKSPKLTSEDPTLEGKRGIYIYVKFSYI